MHCGILEKMLFICLGRPGLYGSGTALARLEPRQYVSCRRALFRPFRKASPGGKRFIVALTCSGGCRDHNHRRVCCRSSYQPGLFRLGLPEHAAAPKRTDLSALLFTMVAHQPFCYVFLRLIGRKNTAGLLTGSIAI